MVVELAAAGGAGLRKGDAKAAVELLTRTVVRGEEGVVLGPVDEVAPATSDVLLKTLEERGPFSPRPFLWAWDLGGVAPTVRSRCLVYWAPGRDPRGDPYEGVARGFYGAWVKGDWAAVAEELKDAGKTDAEPLLRASLGVAAGSGEDPAAAAYWEALRPLFDGHPLTPARILSALLEGRLGLQASAAVAP